MTYRPDIDGLRAVAVIAVILFHLNANWLPGGFLGVDIFFVISGYLIGGILYRELSTGTFSLKRFYLRRMRRILPAFFAVVIPTLLLSRFIIVAGSPDAMKAERSALSATVFANNLFSTFYTDYFDTNNLNPFLHLWSLSVEEQFYFLYPLVLWGIMKVIKRWLPLSENQWKTTTWVLFLLMILCCISAFAEVRFRGTIGQTYYLPLPRFGELLVGALLAIFKAHKFSQSSPDDTSNAQLAKRTTAVGIGAAVALLLCLVLPFPTKMPWFPGLLALVPCLATATIIYSGAFSRGLIYRFLAATPINFIGRISYSLYLWHLPILTFGQYLNDGQLTLSGLLISSLLIVLCSLLSYYFVEQPLRHKQWSFAKTGVISYVLPTLCVVALCNFRPFEKEMKPYTTCGTLRNINYMADYVGDSTQKATTLIAGDSYTQHLYDFFDKVAKSEGWRARISYLPGTPYLGNDFIRQNVQKDGGENLELAQQRNALINKELAQFDHIILSMAWGFQNTDPTFMPALTKALQRFEKEKKQVTLIFSGVNYDKVGIKETYYNMMGLTFLYSKENPATCHLRPLDQEEESKTLQYIKTHFPKVRCVVMHDLLPHSPLIDGKTIVMNDAHYNTYGANYLADQYIAAGRRLLVPSPNSGSAQ